jgi:dTDP-glucose 4,6-dehydratase
MTPSFAVIGSNSFSGSSFISTLLRQGYDVIGMSRSPEPHDVFLPYKWHGHVGNFTFHQIDINHDLEKADRILRRARPSHIVNFAAQSMVGESWKHPADWMMTNVVSTVCLHDVLRHYDWLDRYVHVTTPEVYGSTSDFIQEDMPFRPSTPYAVSRAAGDMSLRAYMDAFGLPAVSTRAANVYGPGQQLYRIIPRAILFALSGERLQLHGGGASRRSFIHIDDVSSATLAIALRAPVGETYHISTNEIVSIRELSERIYRRADVDFGSAVDIVGERTGKDEAYMLDSGKLRSSLGWKDEIPLDAGLEDCFAWVLQHRDVLATLPNSYQHKA